LAHCQPDWRRNDVSAFDDGYFRDLPGLFEDVISFLDVCPEADPGGGAEFLHVGFRHAEGKDMD